MGYTKYTPAELQVVIAAATSWSDVLDHYGLAYTGSARTYLKRRAETWGLDVGHLTSRAPKRNGRIAHRLTPDEVFIYGNPREKTERLRRLLIEVGVSYECQECGLGAEWRGSALVLQVDHRDGDRKNNRRENLRFLCPNCHSQTETWGKVKGVSDEPASCQCGAPKSRRSEQCRACYRSSPVRKPRASYPSDDDLISLVQEHGTIAEAARQIGVSRHALSGRIHRRGLHERVMSSVLV